MKVLLPQYVKVQTFTKNFTKLLTHFPPYDKLFAEMFLMSTNRDI